jgi:hypothetical protein
MKALTRTAQTCEYCGRRNQSISVHSGIWECEECWNYRKLDGPAAAHWAKVAADFLSNVDMYDLMHYFQKAGLKHEESETMLTAAQKLRDFSQALVDKGPVHMWPKMEADGEGCSEDLADAVERDIEMTAKPDAHDA